jgi:hypothetical protein
LQKVGVLVSFVQVVPPFVVLKRPSKSLELVAASAIAAYTVAVPPDVLGAYPSVILPGPTPAPEAGKALACFVHVSPESVDL